MTTSPRGLRPREPLRLLRDRTGALVVDDDTTWSTTAPVGSMVLSALARHGGHLDTGTLLEELSSSGTAPDLAVVAQGVADLVHDGLLVRTAPVATRRRVRVVAVDDVGTAEFLVALRAGGLRRVDDDADLVVVVCRDHRSPRLRRELQALQGAGTPFLLVRFGTSHCWTGPLFDAGPGTSCPDCVLDALQRNLPPLPEGVDGPGTVVPARSAGVLARSAAGVVAGTVDALLEALADVGDVAQHWATTVGELDLRTASSTAHPVLTCPHTAGTVERGLGFLDRTRALTSAVTGVLAPITLRRTGGGHVLASTTHPVRWRTAPGGPSRWIRATATAVGADEDSARAAATGEAVERYSASWHGDETRTRCTAAELLADPAVRVVLPADLAHFSAAQVSAGEGPPPLPPELVTDFSPLRRLTPANVGDSPPGPAWIVSAAAYFGHPDVEVSRFTRTDSNGCAVGPSSAAATLSGVLELVERDAVALWWWPRTRVPGVPETVLGRTRAPVVGELGRRGRTLHLLDVTTDLGVPVVVAVGVQRDGTCPLFGFGAHPDVTVAARRAARELLQVVVLLQDAPGEGFSLPARTGPDGRRWEDVHVDQVPFVRPHGVSTPRRWTSDPSGVEGDLDEVLRRLAGAGVEAFALDLTRPETGVDAVRVVAPALRPWYRRLGPGRLRLPAGPNPWTLPV